MPLEIITEDQDFTHEWLRQGQVLEPLRHHPGPGPRGCNVVALGAMDYVAIASPLWASEQLQGGPLTPHNFHTQRYIAYNRKDDMALCRFVGT